MDSGVPTTRRDGQGMPAPLPTARCLARGPILILILFRRSKERGSRVADGARLVDPCHQPQEQPGPRAGIRGAQAVVDIELSRLADHQLAGS
jgi:hypothetical protein